jgi:hypothetical protein
MSAGITISMYLEVPTPEPKALQQHRGEATFELCQRCWQPVLLGKLDAHLEAITHRQPPMGAQSPEG